MRVRAVVPMVGFVSFVSEDVPDIPQSALLAAAAGESAPSSSPARHIPAAEAERAKTTTMEADRHRRCREVPPIATAWPGCPTPGGAWSAGAPGRPGRPGREAWRDRDLGEGPGAVVGPDGRAAGVAWRRRRDTPPSSPFFHRLRYLGWLEGKLQNDVRQAREFGGDFGLSVACKSSSSRVLIFLQAKIREAGEEFSADK